MMPSRGIQLARGQAPRLIRPQCRNLSSAPRPHRRPSHSRTNAILLTSRPWTTRSILPAAAAAASIPAVRHASSWSSWLPWAKKEVDVNAPAQPQPPPASTLDTSPASQAPEHLYTAPSAHAPTPSTAAPVSPPAASHPPPLEPSAFPDLDTIILDVDGDPTNNIANIPEGIGYLHQLGIDYGWGPTSCIQWVFEHIHVYTGLPWWASILATGAALRLLTVPLVVKQSDSMARTNAMGSITKPMMADFRAAQKAGDKQATTAHWMRMAAVRKRAGIKMRHTFYPMIAQGILGYCGFKLMHALAVLPVPGFHDGGFLWLQDLTLPDGYLILPVLMGATLHAVVRFGGETGAQASTELGEGMRKTMLWIMPVIMAGFTAFQPGAVALWFTSTGLVGIATGQLLRNPLIRRLLKIAPLYKPQNASERPPDHLKALMSQMGVKAFDAPIPAPTPTPLAPTAGKNTAFMKPTYQTPTLNVRSTTHRTSGHEKRTTIDTTLVAPESTEMIQPRVKTDPPAAKATFSEKFQAAQDAVKHQMARSPEAVKQAEKDAYKRRVDDYEKKAREKAKRKP